GSVRSGIRFLVAGRTDLEVIRATAALRTRERIAFRNAGARRPRLRRRVPLHADRVVVRPSLAGPIRRQVGGIGRWRRVDPEGPENQPFYTPIAGAVHGTQGEPVRLSIRERRARRRGSCTTRDRIRQRRRLLVP